MIRLTGACVGPRVTSLGVPAIGVVRFTLAPRTTATKNGYVFANVCFPLSSLNYSGVSPKSRISALLDRPLNAGFGRWLLWPGLTARQSFSTVRLRCISATHGIEATFRQGTLGELTFHPCLPAPSLLQSQPAIKSQRGKGIAGYLPCNGKRIPNASPQRILESGHSDSP